MTGGTETETSRRMSKKYKAQAPNCAANIPKLKNTLISWQLHLAWNLTRDFPKGKETRKPISINKINPFNIATIILPSPENV